VEWGRDSPGCHPGSGEATCTVASTLASSQLGISALIGFGSRIAHKQGTGKQWVNGCTIGTTMSSLVLCGAWHTPPCVHYPTLVLGQLVQVGCNCGCACGHMPRCILALLLLSLSSPMMFWGVGS
jgi:hypothetical protein